MKNNYQGNLRKCKIKELDTAFKYFIGEDLSNHSLKKVYLSSKQRLFYKSYSIDDCIYIAKTLKGTWKLITGTDFKRNNFLFGLKGQLDKSLNEKDY